MHVLKTDIDEDLLQRIIKGDTVAYATVYELFKDLVFAFAYSLIKDRDTAEEVVQQVFFKLWEKREQIDIKQSFPAYIKRITYNHIIDFFRKVKRDTQLQAELQRNMESLCDSHQDMLIRKDLETVYRTAIDMLPAQKKNVYLLAKEENMSYDEIAAEMNISKNTVRNHMTIAIQFVRDYVSKHYVVSLIFLFVLFKAVDQ